MNFQILGANVSPFVRKVRAMLAEKNIPYDYEQVSPFSPPEGWRNISPLGKIPVLKDGDRLVNDSSVICQYIERKNPEPQIFPRDLDGYTDAIWLEEFIDGGFTPVAGGKVFFPLVVEPMMSGDPAGSEAEAAAAQVIETEFPTFWSYLESQLGDKDFFVGDQISIADLAIASIHVNLRHAGVLVPVGDYPNLSAFIDRMHSRESFRRLIEEEAPTWGARAG
ncbi:MAG: glutathione S-transferase family protein [Pseudomonadota bacterium]